MLLFGIAAVLMVAAAVAFVLPPLLGTGKMGGEERNRLNVALYRDRRAELDAELADGSLSEEEFARAEAELQRDLLANVGDEAAERHASWRWAAWPVGVGIPLVVVVLYLTLGNPSLVAESAAPATAGAAAPAAGADGMGDIDTALADLEARLQREPQNMEGWTLLGRSLMATGRYRQAADIFARAMQHLGETNELLLGRAQALAMAQNNRLDGEPIAIVRRVLERDGNDIEARWLAGIYAFEQGDYPLALDHWQAVKGQVGDDAELMASVNDAIARAEAMLSGEPAPGETSAAPPAAAGTTAIEVRVSVAGALMGQIPEGATLFLFARPPGQRMPVAAVRRPAAVLPLTVTLDDSTSMTGSSLAGFDELDVVARISAGGMATAASGDLEGEVRTRPGESVDIVIDRRIP